MSSDQTHALATEDDLVVANGGLEYEVDDLEEFTPEEIAEMQQIREPSAMWRAARARADEQLQKHRS